MAVSSLWMRQMFDSAAKRYVLLNKILTFGQDEKWRQAALEAIEPQADAQILDICTGTADLVLKIAKKFSPLPIYALDYSPRMLAVARERLLKERKFEQNIIFKEGDCTSLEFDGDYFDYVTISFGFRNLSFSRENLGQALKEIYRVLKKGGRFIIIETSQPANIFVRKLFHFYAEKIVPLVGRFTSGESIPYNYLGNSIVKFFSQDELIDILESGGFKKENTKAFMFGMILLCVVKK